MWSKSIQACGAASLAVLIGGCATPTVVQPVKPGDTGLSCAQLQNEYADAERYRKEADNEKSVTGGNVVRAIFFWPAILGTAANANEAIAAADNRKVYLANQMNTKNCAIPTTGGAVAEAKPGDAAKPAEPKQLVAMTGPQSKEAQLTELKRLFDAGLYADKQKSILDAP
jgi:hypothetical protein